MNESLAQTRRASGWLATAVGGTIGGGVLGAIAMVATFAYFDAQPVSDLGDLGWVFMWTGIGIFVGATFGAAGVLRLRGYRRALGSGLAFASTATLLLLSWALVAGQVLETWDEGLLFFMSLMTAIPLSAWSARMLVTLGGSGAGSAPPG